MNGIQFVTDDKGRKVAVVIDLKKHGVRLQDFWDGLISPKEGREVDSIAARARTTGPCSRVTGRD